MEYMTTTTKATTFPNFINGVWKSGSTEEVLTSINPANKLEAVGKRPEIYRCGYG